MTHLEDLTLRAVHRCVSKNANAANPSVQALIHGFLAYCKGSLLDKENTHLALWGYCKTPEGKRLMIEVIKTYRVVDRFIAQERFVGN